MSTAVAPSKKCSFCKNLCTFICPVVEATGNQSYLPSRLALWVNWLETGLATPDEEMGIILYHCATCRMCEIPCPYPDVSVTSMVENARRLFVQEGTAPAPVLNLYEALKGYDPSQAAGLQAIAAGARPSASPEVVYFAGSAIAEHAPQRALAALEILEKAGVAYALAAPSEWPSSDYLFSLGITEPLAEFARRNVERLNSLGAKTVVFGDPADAVSFKERYPDLGVPTDSFELLTIYEYLDRLVQEGRLKLPAAVGSAAGNGAAKGEARRVAFHDCTHLGRHLGCYDGPRRLIQRLGLELVELWRSREKGLQCGAGMHTAFPRVADDMAAALMTDVDDVGVDLLVVASPDCHRQLDAKGKAQVIDLVELIRQSLA